MRKLLTVEIELMGFQPITATNGREAVEKASAERPHLVLMDIMMPGMDGREATRALRANRNTSDIPIIAETGLSEYSDVDSCFEAGCNDCLIKPFTYAELAEKVR